MIKDELIRTSWQPSSKKHYIQLGYVFTRFKEELWISSLHLPSQSDVRVVSICNKCNKERLVRFSKYSPLCRGCSWVEKQAKGHAVTRTLVRRLELSEAMRQRSNKIHTPEWREKHVTRSKAQKGCLNPNWNKDLIDKDRQRQRETTPYKQWRLAVYARDKHTCQACLKVGGIINAHHLNSYAVNKDLRTDVDNGVTLCSPCHKRFHKLYGGSKNTREQFEEWKSADRCE
jgi:5-methylcytosine-specific restriction endonuclease McrA